MALRNGISYFGKFKWRDDPRLSGAIEKLMEQLNPPIRLKVKFGTTKDGPEVRRGTFSVGATNLSR